MFRVEQGSCLITVARFTKPGDLSCQYLHGVWAAVTLNLSVSTDTLLLHYGVGRNWSFQEPGWAHCHLAASNLSDVAF